MYTNAFFFSIHQQPSLWCVHVPVHIYLSVLLCMHLALFSHPGCYSQEEPQDVQRSTSSSEGIETYSNHTK